VNFSPTLQAQLNRFRGRRFQVATDNNLIEGELVRVENGVIQMQETVDGYERETQTTFIPLSATNFIREV